MTRWQLSFATAGPRSLPRDPRPRGVRTPRPARPRARPAGRLASAPHGSAPIAGTSERFDLTGRGDGEVPPGARSNDQYVTAENAGALPLIASRAARGPREMFLLVRDHDGTVSFLAGANGSTCVRTNAGAAPLIANPTAIGPRARFDLITH
jgi:alpha-L-fucosidase 2